jgi:PKD repeat protein
MSGSSSTTHTYAHAGTYTVALTVVDADGCSTLTVFTGQTASCNGSPAATTIRTVGVPAPTVVSVPAVSGLRVSPRTFAAAGRKLHGKCIRPSKKNKRDKACQLSIKLNATYTLNAAANVTFKLALQRSGRKVSGKCVKATRKNKHHSKCTLLVSVQKTFTRSGVAGSNKFSFARKLAAGTYELTAAPASGTPQTVTFRVTG